ncbi:hypothetical protein [Xanthomonas vasicola]|uniref:hypothetical protein n=1 Tax=Xanthomonas vasicola TaxID=56459 RepID=UPI00035D9F14|nr:hypothetical protein [Xanthomonas vasicola]KFA29067.1 hypothetical protein KW5_0108360 [Xanthomonas vasicola pv. vasculorum NCPPB 1326]KFA31143.1 hypothetical protein KWG_0111380 [Xanthomonas vasicola pv. vasculorum NCPPB 1381]
MPNSRIFQMPPRMPHDPARLIPGHRQHWQTVVVGVLQHAVELCFGCARVGQVDVVAKGEQPGVVGERVTTQMPFGMDVAPLGNLRVEIDAAAG